MLGNPYKKAGHCTNYLCKRIYTYILITIIIIINTTSSQVPCTGGEFDNFYFSPTDLFTN